jgi:hypothetical protein
MLFTQLRAAVVLTLGLAAATTTLAGRPAAGQDDAKPAATKAADPPAKEKDVVAWGRKFGGLQAGVVVRGGVKPVYRHGDTIALGVRVRNVGKEAVSFGYVPQFLDETPPAVTDADGATLTQPRLEVLGLAHPAVKVTLEPGKEVELASRIFGTAGRRYELLPERGKGERATRERPLFVGTGIVSLRYERVFGDSSIGKAEVDPGLLRLGTGTLELQVEPAAARKK